MVKMNSVRVLDGGFSTQLALITGNVVDGDPLWTAHYLATDPEAVLRTHLEFLKAGAEVIITNSYQASIPGLMKYLGIDEESSYELIKESVRIARRAVEMHSEENRVGKKLEIAGSVGPYGACLLDGSEYTGSYVDIVSMDDILEWHRPRILALMEEEVDLLAVETIPALTEGEALLRLLKNHPRQKFWLSFQCKDEVLTAHGEVFTKAVKKSWEISSDQLVAVGCNCVNPKFVGNLFGDLPDGIPLIAYPNSGEEYSIMTGWTGEAKHKDFADLVPEWLDVGVRYVGGCCRTDATHVSAIKDAVNEWTRKKGKRNL